MTSRDHHPDTADALAGEGDLIEPVADVRAHASLFVPTVLVALIYGLAWLALWLAGKGDGALARVVLLVLLLAPPLLLARAFLKYYSVGLAVADGHLLIAPGWPRQSGIEVPLTTVDHVEVRATPLARWFGTGTVTIQLSDGDRLKVADLARAEQMARYVRSRARQARRAAASLQG